VIALEHIQPEDWAAVARVIDTLRSLVIDTGGVSLGIRVGTGSATFTASPTSAAVTVPHGLGRVPAIAAGFSRNAQFGYSVTGRDATNLTVVGSYEPGTNQTGTITFDWMVIG